MRSSTLRGAAAMLVAALAALFGSISSAQTQVASPRKGGTRIVCYTAYDADYFYLAAVVQKPNLAGMDTAMFGDPVRDDAVAVFLQTEDQPVTDHRSAHSAELAVSVAGGGQLYRGADAVPLHDFSSFLLNSDKAPVPFKYGVRLKGQLNREGGDNTGYSVEMAIPWIEVGGPPKSGQKLRFNVVAYSAAAGSSPIISLSPDVKTATEVQNPSLWSEMVFTDSPVHSVGSAPDAKVCARVINSKPLIDGDVSDGEWNTVTAFGFGEDAPGSAAVGVKPAPVVARIHPKLSLHRARPPIMPPAVTVKAVAPHAAQVVPRLLFALYDYSFQNDPRRNIPIRSVRSANGASLLALHPMDGSGPWMTYDCVGWHVRQLTDLRRAGVDVVMPIFRADTASRQGYAIRGLQTMAEALRYLAQAGQDYPLVALYLDTSSFAPSDSAGEKPDLLRPRQRALLYAAIKDFFLQVPQSFRVTIPLDAKNGYGPANVVVVSSASPLASVDDGAIDYCRSHFLADFGSDLVVLGGSDFKGRAKLDGYVDDTNGRGFQMVDGGWIKSASVGTGYDVALAKSAAKSGALARDDGRTYKRQWQLILARRPDWVFIDGWNDFEHGDEIAPTLQGGVEFVDMTRLYSRELAGAAPLQASFLGCSLPQTLQAGATYSAVLRVQNSGLSVWTPTDYTITVQMRARSGAGGKVQSAPLPGMVIAGQAITVPFTITAPSEPGEYTVLIDVAQTGKKGIEPGSTFSAHGGAPLAIGLHVVGRAGPQSGSAGLTVVACDLPTTLEAGGFYMATVTLRNDGQEAWKRGGAGRICAHVWRYTSAANVAGDEESAQPVQMADASAVLPQEVPPGQQVTVSVPIAFCHEDGSPLTAWSQADDWTYEIRWEYSADEASAAGAVSQPVAIALTQVDPGAQFIADATPSELPGDHRVPVKLGLRNLGPDTWVRDQVRIGYHWYYFDGTEAVWQDELTPVTQNVEPGGAVPEMLAWITAPPDDGTYWLVWDVKVGDDWVSTLPGVRFADTIVRQVQVVHGRLQFADLSKAFNLDGVASASSPSDGDFDGAGRSLPSELVPPFASSDYAPSTIWLPTAGSGLDSSRRISFLWGQKGDKQKSLVQCLGQRVVIAQPKDATACKAVHLLAASTKGASVPGFTLFFDDGGQQFTSVSVSRWDGPPMNNEEIGFEARYSRTPSGDQPDKPVRLFHYVIKVPEKSKLVSIQMPNASDLKIAAITLEK